MEMLFVLLMDMPAVVIIVVIAVLFLFGGKKIPEFMKGIGEGMKEFKKASQLDEEKPKSESLKSEPAKKDESIKG